MYRLMALLESLGTDETERAEDMEQDLPSGDPQIENRDDPNPMTLHIEATDDPQPTTLETNEKEIILDGMAVVDEVSGQQIKTFLEMAQAFVRAVDSKSQNHTLVHVVCNVVRYFPQTLSPIVYVFLNFDSNYANLVAPSTDRSAKRLVRYKEYLVP